MASLETHRDVVQRRGPGAFIALFVATYVVLYLGYMAISDDLLRRVVYPWGVAKPASLLVRILDPSVVVLDLGWALSTGSAQLEIVRGCDGSGAFMLLAAAVIAYGADLKWKLIGIGGALLLLTAANAFRVAGLYLLLMHDAERYSVLHVYVFPTLLVLLSSVYFVSWVSRADSRRFTPDQTEPR